LKTGTPPGLDGRHDRPSRRSTSSPATTQVPVSPFQGSRDMHPRSFPVGSRARNARTHDIIRAGLDRSPLFTGVQRRRSALFGPSIEDKGVRFAERDSHQIFLEPEGLTTQEIYPNGISRRCRSHVQLALVRSMRGCERAEHRATGLSIEYDYFDPRALKATAWKRKRSRTIFRRANQRHDRPPKRPRHKAFWPASTRDVLSPAK